MCAQPSQAVSNGIGIFTDLMNKYGKTIARIDLAEAVFSEFMRSTEGLVILDFLDTDNADHVEEIEVDRVDGFVTIYTRKPSSQPEIRLMEKSIFPYDVTGLVIYFKNLKFISNKNNECIGIIVNGYTLMKKQPQQYAAKGGSNILSIDSESTFFATDIVREKNGLKEFLRFVKTPISSFWIIPKNLRISPHASKYLLYHANLDKLRMKFDNSLFELNNKLCSINDLDDREDYITMYGNRIRSIAEALFKLILCFHSLHHKLSKQVYNLPLLGDLCNVLKKVYCSEDDKDRFTAIEMVANQLSHDAGLPIDLNKFMAMCSHIDYFMNDFSNQIETDFRGILESNEVLPSPATFIKENIMLWNYASCLPKNCITQEKIAFALKITPSSFSFSQFLAGEENLLCSDGSVKSLTVSTSDVYLLYDRTLLKETLNELDNYIKKRCQENGYSTDIYACYFQPVVIKRGKPEHLFTLDEIKGLMTVADDSRNNQLVIDENGCAQIVHGNDGQLYPVRIETWCAGNNYVGAHSSLSDAEPSYHLCLDLWLQYLKTGISQYSDSYVDLDEGLTISDIMKFY